MNGVLKWYAVSWMRRTVRSFLFEFHVADVCVCESVRLLHSAVYLLFMLFIVFERLAALRFRNKTLNAWLLRLSPSKSPPNTISLRPYRPFHSAHCEWWIFRCAGNGICRCGHSIHAAYSKFHGIKTLKSNTTHHYHILWLETSLCISCCRFCFSSSNSSSLCVRAALCNSQILSS